MARRLRLRGAGVIRVAPIWLPDWLLLPATGYGRLIRRTGRAVVRTYVEGGCRPIMLIGHSAGGVLARLALAPVPYRGNVAAVGDAVGALVTLGSPHVVSGGTRRQRVANDACDFLERVAPGAFLAPRTGYLTVASTAVVGGPRGLRDGRHALAGGTYAALLGEGDRLDPSDGVVPLASAHLDGARQITLGRVGHGQGAGIPWYGDDTGLDGWWDAALEVWRTAVAARSAGVRTEA